jgi:hypothetical protein
MIIDISIDFDYFVRELIEWDWGHGEGIRMFLTEIWPIRYRQIDLWRECNPVVYADVMPDEFGAQLSDQGLSLQRMRHLGYAESHKWALPFLLDKSSKVPADVMINFDAHHDCYTDFRAVMPDSEAAKPSCENWVQHYLDVRPSTKVMWVVPKWRIDAIGNDMRKVERCRKSPITKRKPEVTTLDKLSFNRDRVRNVFICRSGAWVPPHLDPLFILLLRSFGNRVGKVSYLGDRIVDRSPYALTSEEVDKSREEYQKLLEGMRTKADVGVL